MATVENKRQSLVTMEQAAKANQLLDQVMNNAQLKNDAALARALEVAPPIISKIRHNRLPIGDSMLIRLHEFTGTPIKQFKDMLGMASVQRA